MTTSLKEMQYDLSRRIKALGNAAVAFSGGTDSTFLLASAHEILGSRTLAVIVRSCLFPSREFESAVQFVQQSEIPYVVYDLDPFTTVGFAQNPHNRCLLCKRNMFLGIRRIAEERHIPFLIEGSHVEDSEDYRPGMQALTELGVLSPLRQSGFTKNDIRQLARLRGLPNWDKPSLACLASRIPYGTEITMERLTLIDEAEQYVLTLGARQIRVRFHDNLARIETDEEGWKILEDRAVRQKIHQRFTELGFTYITLDMLGYRSGSLNAAI